MAFPNRPDAPELPDFSMLKRLARDQLIYLLEQVSARHGWDPDRINDSSERSQDACLFPAEALGIVLGASVTGAIKALNEEKQRAVRAAQDLAGEFMTVTPLAPVQEASPGGWKVGLRHLGR